MADSATPRPWFIVGLPWVNGAGLIYAGSEDPHVGNMVADVADSLNPEADAALIVEAVNAYDRLRVIEAAARRVLTADGAAESGADEADRGWDEALEALRAALSKGLPR